MWFYLIVFFVFGLSASLHRSAYFGPSSARLYILLESVLLLYWCHVHSVRRHQPSRLAPSSGTALTRGEKSANQSHHHSSCITLHMYGYVTAGGRRFSTTLCTCMDTSPRGEKIPNKSRQSKDSQQPFPLFLSHWPLNGNSYLWWPHIQVNCVQPDHVHICCGSPCVMR